SIKVHQIKVITPLNKKTLYPSLGQSAVFGSLMNTARCCAEFPVVYRDLLAASIDRGPNPMSVIVLTR
ncbi:MAG: hypothetical protein ACYCT0_06150, partial [Sulfobacillus sp.]